MIQRLLLICISQNVAAPIHSMFESFGWDKMNMSNHAPWLRRLLAAEWTLRCVCFRSGDRIVLCVLVFQSNEQAWNTRYGSVLSLTAFYKHTRKLNARKFPQNSQLQFSMWITSKSTHIHSALTHLDHIKTYQNGFSSIVTIFSCIMCV